MDRNFGITRALGGLYGSSQKSENAKVEMGVLSNLMQMKKQDEAEAEMAQIKAQQYEEEVSKFSDTLLAPDRDRINAKAKALGHNVRKQVQMYGGDMKKFLANGGHKALSEYKNNLVRSEESSKYLDNKKNMDMLVKAQFSGMGHLINPTDHANLENYQKTGEGNITYTGMMNEITMPNADNYDLGVKVPAEDILRNEGNYTKIYGNYKMTHPELGEPTDEDLMAFIDKNYQVQGSNWQRQASFEKAKAAQIAEMAKLQKQQYDQRKKDEAEGTGPFAKNYSNQYSGQTVKLLGYLPQTGTASEYQEGFWDSFEYKDQINNIATGDYKDFATNYNLKQDGFLDVFSHQKGDPTRWVGETFFHDQFAPRNAKTFYKGVETAFAKSILGLSDKDINEKNKTILGLTPQKDWMLADGTQVKDLQDELIYDEYTGDYKIDGIINIATVDSDNGSGGTRTNMIMNLVDKNGKIKKDQTKKMDEQLVGSQLTHKMAMVLTNEDGVRFYVPVETQALQTNKLRIDLGAYDDLAPTIKDQEYRKREDDAAMKIVAAKEAELDSFYNEIEGNVEYFRPMYAESVQFSKNGQYDARRDDMIKSFYSASAQYSNLIQHGNTNAPPSAVRDATNVRAFTNWVNDISAESDFKYEDDIKNYGITDEDIIKKMMKNDPENAGLYELWLQNFIYLSKRQ